MLRVDQKDVAAIYDRLVHRCDAELGDMPLPFAPMTGLRISATGYGRTCEIVGKLELVPRKTRCYELPVQTLSARFPPPKQFARENHVENTKHFFQTQRNKREYFVCTYGDCIRVRVECKLGQPSSFAAGLREFGMIFGAMVNGFCKNTGVLLPAATFFIRLKSYQARQSAGGGPSHSTDDPHWADNSSATSIDSFERTIEVAEPGVTFTDVAGLAEPKKLFRRIFYEITCPSCVAQAGRDPARGQGILLTGPPGCGKTLLVRAFAGKLKEELKGKAKFYSVNYCNLASMWRGEEAKFTRKIFELAKRNEEKNVVTILFFDEIHMIGQSDRMNYKDEVLNTLLANMDGMSRFSKLVTIGATYLESETLDAALTRPGRLSREIRIAKPSAQELQEIFKLYIAKANSNAAKTGKDGDRDVDPEGDEEEAKKRAEPPPFGELDLSLLAGRASGYTGADVAEVVDRLLSRREDELIDRKIFAEKTSEMAHKFLVGILDRPDVRQASEKMLENYSTEEEVRGVIERLRHTRSFSRVLDWSGEFESLCPEPDYHFAAYVLRRALGPLLGDSVPKFLSRSSKECPHFVRDGVAVLKPIPKFEDYFFSDEGFAELKKCVAGMLEDERLRTLCDEFRKNSDINAIQLIGSLTTGDFLAEMDRYEKVSQDKTMGFQRRLTA